jgi:hypothetical protein
MLRFCCGGAYMSFSKECPLFERQKLDMSMWHGMAIKRGLHEQHPGPDGWLRSFPFTKNMVWVSRQRL